MLGHLVARGVFTEPAPGRFALNAAAERCATPTPFLDLDGIGGRLAGAWSTLPAYVRTGAPAYARAVRAPVLGGPGRRIPRLAASFDDLIGPGGHGTPDPRLELADGWDGVAHVVDVGGGTGAMLTELLRRLPGCAARSSTCRAPSRAPRRSTARRTSRPASPSRARASSTRFPPAPTST